MDTDRLTYIENVNASRFNDTVSRRRFMQAVLVAAGGVAGVGAMAGTGTAFADSTATIINTAITAEALAITYLGAVIQDAFANASGTDATIKAILVAARAEEQDHYNFLHSAGATPLLTTFSVPSSANPKNKTAALTTLVAAEGLFVNAYLAAVNQFASQGNYKLATYSASIMGVEAEHRALARAGLALRGDSSYAPPNNVAFEQAPLPSVSAVGDKLKSLGFFSPTSGNSVAYPGPGTVDMSSVSGTSAPTLSPESPGMPNTGVAPQDGISVPSGIAGLALGGGAAALAGMLWRQRGNDEPKATE